MFYVPLSFVAWTPSDAARERRDDLLEAIRVCGVSRVEMSQALGLTEQQISMQLGLRYPLNAWRLADLFDVRPDLEDEFHKIRLQRHGWRALRDEWLLKLVDAVTVIVSTQRKKPMARAALKMADEERKVG